MNQTKCPVCGRLCRVYVGGDGKDHIASHFIGGDPENGPCPEGLAEVRHEREETIQQSNSAS